MRIDQIMGESPTLSQALGKIFGTGTNTQASPQKDPSATVVPQSGVTSNPPLSVSAAGTGSGQPAPPDQDSSSTTLPTVGDASKGQGATQGLDFVKNLVKNITTQKGKNVTTPDWGTLKVGDLVTTPKGQAVNVSGPKVGNVMIPTTDLAKSIQQQNAPVAEGELVPLDQHRPTEMSAEFIDWLRTNHPDMPLKNLADQPAERNRLYRQFQQRQGIKESYEQILENKLRHALGKKMNIQDLASGVPVAITNEEREFIRRHPDRVRISALEDRDQWIAQHLVRKGVYKVGKDDVTLINNSK
jgi:hypothetical protein